MTDGDLRYTGGICCTSAQPGKDFYSPKMFFFLTWFKDTAAVVSSSLDMSASRLG